MRVFIAGGTGAIGRPIIAALRQEHELHVLTHTEARAKQIATLGVVPVAADVFNASELERAVSAARPDVVVEMLTSIPKESTPAAMAAAAAADRRVRVEGGSNLQQAAAKAGAQRYIVLSAAFLYASGKGLATEETPFAVDASPGIAAYARTYAEIEERVLSDHSLQGVALRFGFFYGPGTWWASDGDVAKQVRSGERYVVGPGSGVWNFVHIEDAAAAVKAALTGPAGAFAGAFNIVNDTPVTLAQFLPAYAHFLGAPPPPSRSVEEEMQANGADWVYYALNLRGASNAKAKRELGLTFRPLEWMQFATAR